MSKREKPYEYNRRVFLQWLVQLQRMKRPSYHSKSHKPSMFINQTLVIMIKVKVKNWHINYQSSLISENHYRYWLYDRNWNPIIAQTLVIKTNCIIHETSFHYRFSIATLLNITVPCLFTYRWNCEPNDRLIILLHYRHHFCW